MVHFEFQTSDMGTPLAGPQYSLAQTKLVKVWTGIIMSACYMKTFFRVLETLLYIVILHN